MTQPDYIHVKYLTDGRISIKMRLAGREYEASRPTMIEALRAVRGTYNARMFELDTEMGFVVDNKL
jgi:hypothetical protein